jgi:hypothetical protein
MIISFYILFKNSYLLSMRFLLYLLFILDIDKSQSPLSVFYVGDRIVRLYDKSRDEEWLEDFSLIEPESDIGPKLLKL